MANKKQTAVEWFFEQLTEVDYNCINKTFLHNNNSLAGYKLRELFQQSKKMEKEQMEIMLVWLYDTDRRPKQIEEVFEQYYKETYG
jgi:hypothetical protein